MATKPLCSVGLKILKTKLNEYLRLAAGGETVLITDRDRVVAEIVPPQPGRSPFLADARMVEAVREGWPAHPHYSLAVVHRRASQS